MITARADLAIRLACTSSMLAVGMYVVVREARYPAEFSVKLTAEFREFQKFVPYFASFKHLVQHQRVYRANATTAPFRMKQFQKRVATIWQVL